ANNPKKLTDPADETLTAIQQVLSVSDEPTDRRTEAPVDRETPPHQYEPAQQYEPTRPYEAPRRNLYESDPAPERDLFEGSAPARDDRPRRLRAGADRVLLRHGVPDVALAGDAPDRPVDGERRAEAVRAGRGRPRFRGDRRPGHPPRGRGDGRRRRARACACRRA